MKTCSEWKLKFIPKSSQLSSKNTFSISKPNILGGWTVLEKHVYGSHAYGHSFLGTDLD